MRYFLAICMVLIAHSVIARPITEPEPVHGIDIETTLGVVTGASNGETDSFKGIPYAQPPVADYRWRPPRPVASWSSRGKLQADKFGADCPQAGISSAANEASPGMSEDCLFLNIWRPAGISERASLPVMVWIHGGAFVVGSGAAAETYGEQFARNGVILVTINYRLGRLGHFAFPALSAEHPQERKGSYAFMDQIMALTWIQKHIRLFGGNENNVTIFGESAGGVSVHALLTIPAADGLFHRAIIESGGGRDGVLTGRPLSAENADRHYPVSAETIGVYFAQKHGIEGTDKDALSKLRALSFEDIVDGGLETDPARNRPIYSGPILDGEFVTETAESAYKAGRQSKVPLLIGSNTAEVPAGFVNAESKVALWQQFGPFSAEAMAAYDPKGDKPLAELLTYVNTDKVWAEPARFTALSFLKNKLPVYVYQFGYVPENARTALPYGAPHASEIPYVFNNLKARKDHPDISVADTAVAELVNQYWANFARSGDPNSNKLPTWPTYSEDTFTLLQISADGKPAAMPDPNKARLDVIEKAVTQAQF